jgi:hypothetical protein
MWTAALAPSLTVGLPPHAAQSFVLMDEMKNRSLAKRLFVIGMFQRESLQFPRRRGQRNHIVVDDFVF